MSVPAVQRSIQALRIGAAEDAALTCRVAEEVAVALSYNGIPHAVVMASPADLDDLAVGYSITDGLCQAGEIEGVAQTPSEYGIELNVRLAAPAFARFLQVRRHRIAGSHTSCGVCGLETLADVPRATSGDQLPATPIVPAAIRRALAQLPDHQPLNRQTGAVHAAAWARLDGGIVLAREDVGRHNALDKLIGARARLPPADLPGFCVLTSRCSHEMVQKSAAAGMGLIVAISAPTALAIREARRLGIGVVALARKDTQTIYAGTDRLAGGSGLRHHDERAS